ncbi:MAG: hypothetical protein CMP23_10845 [Rickettsiales bacterium]|nr:hypothetical protein [Rickettsiales bacterium]
MKRVPVTLLTGFLGAGKTTLLQHLLDARPGLRFAVIENEFGDVGFDGSLMEGKCAALFELNDGCICCSVRQDLIAVFEQLIGGLPMLDHIIIETTGLADPGPVMRIFDLPQMRAALVLDGVVTVVDAAHIQASLNDVAACLEQIAYADVLILNKVDRVQRDTLGSLKLRLRELNPLAAIQLAEFGQVDVELLLDLGGRPLEERVPGELHEAEQHHEHRHDEAIQPVVLELAGEVDVHALDLWLADITRQADSSVLRMKGILAVPGDPRRFVFNGVRDLIDVRPDRPWNEETRFSRIVMIGRSLDLASLQAGFQSCAAASAKAAGPTAP